MMPSQEHSQLIQSIVENSNDLDQTLTKADKKLIQYIHENPDTVGEIIASCQYQLNSLNLIERLELAEDRPDILSHGEKYSREAFLKLYSKIENYLHIILIISVDAQVALSGETQQKIRSILDTYTTESLASLKKRILSIHDQISS